MAYDKLPQSERTRFKVVFEDDQSLPKMTVAAFKSLQAHHDIDTLITCASNTSKAVSALTDRAEIPHIAITSDKEIVEGKKYIVNLWVTPNVEVPLAIKEAKKRGYKKIARITSLHDGTLAFAKVFDQNNKDGAISIVLDEQYDTRVKDFRSFLTKLKSKGPIDTIFVNLFPGQIAVFTKQARALGITAPFFAIELFEDTNEVKLAQSTLNGQWYIQADDGTSSFLQEYTKIFPDASSFAAANGYDAVNLLASAHRSGAQSREAVNRFLHELSDYEGALGTYSASGDNRFDLPAVVKVVTETGFEELS